MRLGSNTWLNNSLQGDLSVSVFNTHFCFLDLIKETSVVITIIYDVKYGKAFLWYK